MKEWYSLDECYMFEPEHIIWLLKHSFGIRAGNWPPKHTETGYIKGGRKPRVKPEAYFEKPCQVIAELEARLQCCGQDGMFLWACYSFDHDDIAEICSLMAGFLNLTPGQVWARARKALAYCTGRDRRDIPYSTFKRLQRRHD